MEQGGSPTRHEMRKKALPQSESRTKTVDAIVYLELAVLHASSNRRPQKVPQDNEDSTHLIVYSSSCSWDGRFQSDHCLLGRQTNKTQQDMSKDAETQSALQGNVGVAGNQHIIYSTCLTFNINDGWGAALHSCANQVTDIQGGGLLDKTVRVRSGGPGTC